LKRFGLMVLLFLTLVGCVPKTGSGNLEKVGLLVPESVEDQVWGTKGYQGLLRIQSKFDVVVMYKEGMNSLELVENAVKEFDQEGVTLIFGHGNEYAAYFNTLAEQYPHIHFVSFNGNAKRKNTTSLNFNAYAMGFFAGMVAAHMTKTDHLGVIAAYEWQPEVEGFYDGALYENDKVKVTISYVGHWDHKEDALRHLETMTAANADVIYPAGDGFNVPIIEKVKEKGLYAIGFVTDQSDLGETTVLTSTVQHVEKLYEMVANQFIEGKLKSGNLYFDFKDGVISLGKFSPHVDKRFQEELNALIKNYIDTGKLPTDE
jgi:transcriptional activator of comK gene